MFQMTYQELCHLEIIYVYLELIFSANCIKHFRTDVT